MVKKLLGHVIDDSPDVIGYRQEKGYHPNDIPLLIDLGILKKKGDLVEPTQEYIALLPRDFTTLMNWALGTKKNPLPEIVRDILCRKYGVLLQSYKSMKTQPTARADQKQIMAEVERILKSDGLGGDINNLDQCRKTMSGGVPLSGQCEPGCQQQIDAFRQQLDLMKTELETLKAKPEVPMPQPKPNLGNLPKKLEELQKSVGKLQTDVQTVRTPSAPPSSVVASSHVAQPLVQGVPPTEGTPSGKQFTALFNRFRSPKTASKTPRQGSVASTSQRPASSTTASRFTTPRQGSVAASLASQTMPVSNSKNAEGIPKGVMNRARNFTRRAAQTTGKALRTGAQATGNFTRRAAQTTGQALRTGAQATGNFTRRAFGKLGNTTQQGFKKASSFIRNQLNSGVPLNRLSQTTNTQSMTPNMARILFGTQNEQEQNRQSTGSQVQNVQPSSQAEPAEPAVQAAQAEPAVQTEIKRKVVPLRNVNSSMPLLRNPSRQSVFQKNPLKGNPLYTHVNSIPVQTEQRKTKQSPITQESSQIRNINPEFTGVNPNTAGVPLPIPTKPPISQQRPRWNPSTKPAIPIDTRANSARPVSSKVGQQGGRTRKRKSHRKNRTRR